MRVGILTGGGDCPGLNAVIRAVFRRIDHHGHTLVGFRHGWRGLLEDIHIVIDENMVRGILDRGGTILRSSGDNPAHSPDGPKHVLETLARYDIEALIVVGGEGTMRGATQLHRDHGVPVIGIPKTIDNDLPGTDMTVGFDSALQVATRALDRLHTTAESHDRVMICEVMGRTAGWLALFAGIAGGADVTLIPEMNLTVEDAAQVIKNRHDQGKSFSLIVVGEGYALRSTTGLFDDLHENQSLDEYGYPRLGGVSNHVARALEDLTGFETRVTILGHVQRGGSPSPADRVLASRFGRLAADLANDKEFGKLTAYRNGEIVAVDIADCEGPARIVPESMFDLVRAFMG